MDLYTEIFDLLSSYGLDGSDFGILFLDIFSVFFGTFLLFSVPLIIIALRLLIWVCRLDKEAFAADELAAIIETVGIASMLLSGFTWYIVVEDPVATVRIFPG